MYMDDIKLFAKNEKELGDSNTNNKNIQTGNRDGIWLRKMCHCDYKKRKKTKNGRNRTAKSRKYQNVRRKGSLQVLRNSGSGHNQVNGDGKKNLNNI